MNIFDSAQTKFADEDRETLEKFAAVLGVPVHHKHADDTIRHNLLVKLGEASVVATEGGNAIRPVDNEGVGITDIDELFKLNLSGKGLWEGRRRIIAISKPDAYEGSHPQFVKWGRQNYWIRYNTQVSVPRPVFNILKDCKPKRLKQQHLTREDGSRAVRNHFVEYQRFQMSDMGDDPETRNLPGSQKEQFRALADMTDGFQKYKDHEFSRGKLMLVVGRLSLHPNRMMDWPDSQIRNAILAKLGHSIGLAAA